MRKNKRQGGGAALKAVGMSDIGKCRKNNEDAYYISAGEDPAENLYLVADGWVAATREKSRAAVQSKAFWSISGRK